ncbi:MAG: helix-turn-helix transcriptional regulator [Bradyrhizobium sp.]|nr:helix-turn-helix transcriptional regulator [Bradyrhizobium sp.]
MSYGQSYFVGSVPAFRPEAVCGMRPTVTEATHLQRAIRQAVEMSGKPRDHWDRQLQEKLGTKGKPIYDIDRGKSKNPSIETIRAIAELFGKPVNFFTTNYDALAESAERPAVVMSDHQPTRSSDVGETVEIVQLDLTLAMGPGTFIEDFVESEMVAFDASVLRRITRTPSNRLRFVTGIGTSHEPKFQSSDQFLIDINERRLTKIDGYYWITYEGAHALKRLRPMSGGRIQIISENKDFDPIEAMAEEIRIEGRAIWFARGL